MPITKLLRAVFGLARSDSEGAESTTVTVEHDPESDDDEAEEAESGAEASAESDHEAAESGAEAGADAESEIVEDDAEAEPVEEDESGAETADVEPETEEDVEPETEEGAEAETEETTGATDTSAGAREGADEPVDTVSGIGPSYAESLGGAGVETVGDLLAADPDDLADRTDISAKRISRWQDAAEDA